MSKEPRKDSTKIDRSIARWQVKHPHYDYDSGVICTPYGMVDAMMQGDDEHFHLTRLDMVVDGRLVIWTWKKRYSQRGAVTLANRMARSLHK